MGRRCGCSAADGDADGDLGPSTKAARRMQIKQGRGAGLVRKREIEAMADIAGPVTRIRVESLDEGE